MSKIVLITGAGISAESGVKTFRDSNGLWENHRVEDVCYFNKWIENYDLVHRFYNARRIQLSEVIPNNTHVKIAQWEKDYTLEHYTQNVDDLCERAGSINITHLHGYLPDVKCVSCGKMQRIGYVESPKYCVFFWENAPQYEMLYTGMNSLKKGDLFIVIGTSGVVLPISRFAAKAKAIGCTTILNNLESNGDIRNTLFDYTLFLPSSQGVEEITKILAR